VAGFSADTRVPADRFPFALRALLPQDITVWQAAETPPDFHAINSCVRKEYTYRLYTGRHPDPFLARYALFHPDTLDVPLMAAAAQDFVGEHDFTALRSMGSTQVKSTVRRVFSSEVTVRGAEIFFTVSANGFLYNMARAMTGTLLYIGLGKLPPDALSGLLSGGRRAEAGPTAPPHGLYMTGAGYEIPLPWDFHGHSQETIVSPYCSSGGCLR
jgi:tRNA pseudouridine38-40 synthase